MFNFYFNKIFLALGKIVGVKVPSKLKERMDRLKDRINWAEEIRHFIEEKVKELEAKENIQKVVKVIQQTKSVPKGFAIRSVREDREGG